MSRLDELLKKILSYPRDTVVSMVLVVDFVHALVAEYPDGDMAWMRYLEERPVEDAVSLYLALATMPSRDDSIEWRARTLADNVLASSLGVRQAIEVEPPEEATQALLDRLDSITNKADLLPFLERHPEVLEPNVDVILAMQSLAALFMSGSPERAARITEGRDNLRLYRTMQDIVKRGNMLVRYTTFYADPARPHPVLKNGDDFDVIAMPDLLYLANSRNGQAILSIPWGDINLNRSGMGKREKSAAGQAWAGLVGDDPMHEGLVLTYYDPQRRGEYKVFLRLIGEKQIKQVLSQIVTYIDDYRYRGGYVRYP